jgi:hypothetical protein
MACNVKDSRALGNDAADDTQAIRNALTTCKAAYFPSVTNLGEISTQHLAPTDGQALRGNDNIPDSSTVCSALGGQIEDSDFPAFTILGMLFTVTSTKTSSSQVRRTASYFFKPHRFIMVDFQPKLS